MLVNKFPFPMTISTEQANNLEEDIMMMDELTPVSTPTDQMTYRDYNWPEPPRCGRTASVSSIASSVSNLSHNGDFNVSSFAAHYKLTEGFEKLLVEVYHNYQTNPTITPFNELNPPSGIINKVSKDALKRAMETNVEIGIEVNNYSLTIIRQKLIQICRQSSISVPGNSGVPASRANSVTSLSNFPTINLSTRFNTSIPTQGHHQHQQQQQQQQQQQPSFDLRTPTDGYFNFETPPPPPPPVAHSQFQTQPLPPMVPSSSSSSQLQPSFLQEAASMPGTPIGEYPPGNVIIPEGLFNATSNRKRESLRLKRSGNKPSYN